MVLEGLPEKVDEPVDAVREIEVGLVVVADLAPHLRRSPRSKSV